LENVDYFEYSGVHFIKGFDHIKEYAFGVEVDPDERIIFDAKEHSKFKWCNYQEAFELLKWEENKRALSRLNELLKP
jgi:dATP pyrophosphohydrolase